MPMPLIKIGYLLVRTVAKPVAGIFKKQAKEHPWFRGACSRLAQSYHRSEVKMKRRIASKNGDVGSELPVEAKIKPLDEQKAIDLGAEFLGEALIFGVAGTLLLLDTARNSRKEEARRAAIESKFTELYDRIRLLESQQLATPDGPPARQLKS